MYQVYINQKLTVVLIESQSIQIFLLEMKTKKL